MSGGLARFDAWFQSDAGAGADPPGALGPLARAAGLAGFALADAGTVAGLAAAAAGAAAAGVAFLPAVALEAEAAGEAATLFGFGIDPASGPLGEALAAAAASAARHEAAVRAALEAASIRLPAGAPVSAAALVAAGFAPSRHAARRRYLDPGGVAHVEPERAAAAPLVAALAGAGAAVGLRPGPRLAAAERAETLEHAAARLRANGLTALLVGSSAERARHAPLATRLGLTLAGGSGHRGAGLGPDPGEAACGIEAWAALGGS